MVKQKPSEVPASVPASDVFRNRIVGEGMADPESLTGHPLNPNIHPRYQQEAVEAILSEVGWVKPVIVNQRSGYILDGHLRVMQAIEQGIKEVPVQYVDLSDAEEVEILAGYDASSKLAETNQVRLTGLLDNVRLRSEHLNEVLSGLRPPEAEGKKEKSPKKKPSVAELTIVRVGAFSFKISNDEFSTWFAGLAQSSGGGEESITHELKKRLGIEDIERG